MPGSFESGAGDLEEIFESEQEESRTETEVDQETTDTPDVDEESSGSDDQKQASVANSPTDAQSQDRSERDSITDTSTDSEPLTVGFEARTDFAAARLANEFVPDSYQKPHAWALGRSSVNDGRQEKKTFFLQKQILELEEECRSEVNEALGGDVPLTDMRELALIIAYHQPERIAKAAREWGSESV